MSMIFGDFVDSVATILGSSSADAGIFLALLVSVTIIMIVLIASRGNQAGWASLAVGIVSTLMFTLMGWLPTWTGGALALIMGIIVAMFFAKGMGGE